VARHGVTEIWGENEEKKGGVLITEKVELQQYWFHCQELSLYLSPNPTSVWGLKQIVHAALSY
jgi:hypothetical protein